MFSAGMECRVSCPQGQTPGRLRSQERRINRRWLLPFWDKHGAQWLQHGMKGRKKTPVCGKRCKLEATTHMVICTTEAAWIHPRAFKGLWRATLNHGYLPNRMAKRPGTMHRRLQRSDPHLREHHRQLSRTRFRTVSGSPSTLAH